MTRFVVHGWVAALGKREPIQQPVDVGRGDGCGCLGLPYPIRHDVLPHATPTSFRNSRVDR